MEEDCRFQISLGQRDSLTNLLPTSQREELLEEEEECN